MDLSRGDNRCVIASEQYPEAALIMVSRPRVSGCLADTQRAQNRLGVAHQQNPTFGPATTRVQTFTLDLFRTVRRTHRSPTSRKYGSVTVYPARVLPPPPRPYLRFVILGDFPPKITLIRPIESSETTTKLHRRRVIILCRTRLNLSTVDRSVPSTIL